MKKTEEKYYCDVCGEDISDTDRYINYRIILTPLSRIETGSELCPSCAKKRLEEVDDERLVKAMSSLKELYYHYLNRKEYPEIKDQLEKYYGQSIDKLLEEVYDRI